MLALNKAFHKVGKRLDMQFSKTRYAASGVISALLTKKADARLLILCLSNLLIRAAKTVDSTVVGIKVLEHWQRLKIFGISLDRYLKKGKIEMLKQKVELSISIQLKALRCWLISKNRLQEQQKSCNKQGSAIVIIVIEESKTKYLHASRFLYKRIIKVVEKYWKIEPNSVCMICCDIEYEQMGNCRNWPSKYIIYSGYHNFKEHYCGVADYNKSK